MNNVSLDKLIADFDPTLKTNGSKIKEGGPVTIWLPAEYKAKYDRLQERSNRRFCKKVRELIVAAIDVTEPKAG